MAISDFVVDISILGKGSKKSTEGGGVSEVWFSTKKTNKQKTWG